MASSAQIGGSSSSSASRTRFQRELQRLRKEPTLPPPLLSLEEVGDRSLRTRIAGPEGSPYANRSFTVLVEAGDEYPFKAPRVRFASPKRVYHPNVCPKSGGICMDILNDSHIWSPSIGIERLLVSVASLLSEPRPEHGLNQEALEHLRNNPGVYAARASEAAGPIGSAATRTPSTSSSPPIFVGTPAGLAGGSDDNNENNNDNNDNDNNDNNNTNNNTNNDNNDNNNNNNNNDRRIPAEAAVTPQTAARDPTVAIRKRTPVAKPLEDTKDYSSWFCLAVLLLFVALCVAQRAASPRA